MLQSIRLSQYKENFTKKKVDGKELLAMQKQDFIVSSVDWVIFFNNTEVYFAFQASLFVAPMLVCSHSTQYGPPLKD